jgi:hypothetical protein
MVGSVLMQRMVEERDFDAIRPVFFHFPAWSGSPDVRR